MHCLLLWVLHADAIIRAYTRALLDAVFFLSCDGGARSPLKCGMVVRRSSYLRKS